MVRRQEINLAVEPIEETPPPPPPERTYSRRRALGLGAAGAAAGVLAALGIPAILPNGEKEQYTYDANKLNGVVTEGLSKNWTDVVVFPGFLLISPGVPFFTTPTLEPKSAVSVPIGPENRLGVLRPFFVNSTLDLHDNELGAELQAVQAMQPIPSGTLGFWDTDRAQFVYCNFNRHAASLAPLTRDFTFQSQSNHHLA